MHQHQARKRLYCITNTTYHLERTADDPRNHVAVLESLQTLGQFYEVGEGIVLKQDAALLLVPRFPEIGCSGRDSEEHTEGYCRDLVGHLRERDTHETIVARLCEDCRAPLVVHSPASVHSRLTSLKSTQRVVPDLARNSSMSRTPML